jgi:sugar lactone lactonase YvrE
LSTATVALDSRDQLGEGPFWDARHDELLRVDIARGRVHGWSPSTGSEWCRHHEGEVSAVVPRARASGWLLAVGHRLLLDDGDRAELLATVEVDHPGNRFNDCKCDPQGRLWAGTMSKDRSPGAAALYRLTHGADIERVVAGTTISNGLAWSPPGDRMYFIDSVTQRVDVFDFDARTGAVADRRTFAEIDLADGLPDGMTVDAEGGVWVCLFGGAAVRRYGDDGKLDAVFELPVTNVTSATFGGPGLRTLYLTSARQRLSERQLAAEPLAGAVLAIEPGVAGLPGNPFAG